MSLSKYITIILCCHFLSQLLCAEENSDHISMTSLGKYETPFRNITARASWNLGPTGARGWVYGHGGGELFFGKNWQRDTNHLGI